MSALGEVVFVRGGAATCMNDPSIATKPSKLKMEQDHIEALQQRIATWESADTTIVPVAPAGYVYAIVRANFLSSPRLVVKIGATGRPLPVRIRQYPKGSRLIFALAVEDCFATEEAILAKLRSIPGCFTPRRDVGLEYFEWLGTKQAGEARVVALITDVLMQGPPYTPHVVDTAHEHTAMRLAIAMVNSYCDEPVHLGLGSNETKALHVQQALHALGFAHPFDTKHVVTDMMGAWIKLQKMDYFKDLQATAPNQKPKWRQSEVVQAVNRLLLGAGLKLERRGGERLRRNGRKRTFTRVLCPKMVADAASLLRRKLNSEITWEEPAWQAIVAAGPTCFAF